MGYVGLFLIERFLIVSRSGLKRSGHVIFVYVWLHLSAGGRFPFIYLRAQGLAYILSPPLSPPIEAGDQPADRRIGWAHI